MRARKQSSTKENTTKILPETVEYQHLQKLNKGVSILKQIILFIFGFGWHIAKLEIRERQA
jgi:flagellar biogenesis protein FliO